MIVTGMAVIVRVVTVILVIVRVSVFMTVVMLVVMLVLITIIMLVLMTIIMLVVVSGLVTRTEFTRLHARTRGHHSTLESRCLLQTRQPRLETKPVDDQHIRCAQLTRIARSGFEAM